MRVSGPKLSYVTALTGTLRWCAHPSPLMPGRDRAVQPALQTLVEKPVEQGGENHWGPCIAAPPEYG